jgi:glutamate-1-semialdehyde 2,1-aminomutase
VSYLARRCPSVYLSGGTNSPIPKPQGYPEYAVTGKGGLVNCEDGRDYIDLWMGYGALLNGHSDPVIQETLQNSLKQGWFFSLPTQKIHELAQLICDAVPCMEKVRFATTGSAVVTYAVRAARCHTGRTKILMARGGYHGVDEGLVANTNFSSGDERPGLLSSANALVDLATFNDLTEFEQLLSTNQYAALIIEPVQANNGCVPPAGNFLQEVVRLCRAHGTVCIFDEVVTGLRLGLGGAQTYFNATPDLCLLAKTIAGGMPLSAVGGKAELMEHLCPPGPVFFGGTFDAHPLAVASACSNLRRLSKASNFYSDAFSLTSEIVAFVESQKASKGVSLAVQSVGSMFSIGFGLDAYTSGLSQAQPNDAMFDAFVTTMAKNGVLYPPMHSETVFVSPAHRPHLPQIKEALTASIDQAITHETLSSGVG